MIAAEGQVLVEHDAELVARQAVVAPADCSIVDEHYRGSDRNPTRAVRARSAPE